MHTRAAPKQKLLDPSLDGRMVADVEAFLAERIALALGRGVAFEQLMLDPGPDFAQDPGADRRGDARRSRRCTRSAGRCCSRSRARTSSARSRPRPPRERLAGTLAAIGYGVDAGAHVLRIHDVRETADFLAVRQVLAGERNLAPEVRLANGLRRQQCS